MTLEDKVSFRNTLLGYKTEEEWKSYRPCANKGKGFYRFELIFEGERITGKKLIKKYSQIFPSDKNYSHRAELNRMLSECNVPQFSFSDTDILKGFLLSAKTELYWKNEGLPSNVKFKQMDFQYYGFKIKGKMLANNVFVELENKNNGTYYAFADYQQDPILSKKLTKANCKEFYEKLFEIAGIKISKSISRKSISKELLRRFLLNTMSEEEWAKGLKNYDNFENMKFKLEGHQQVTGRILRKAYERTKGKTLSLDEMFQDVGISYNAKDLRKIQNRTDFQSEMKNIFTNPNSLRKSFLEIMTEEEWRKPKEFSAIRYKKININGKEINLHTLMYNYSLYKHNLQQNKVEDFLNMNDMRKNCNKKLKGPSSGKILNEILDIAGIQNRWFATFEDINLKDSKFLRRAFLNIEYQGVSISIEDFKKLSWPEKRRARVKDNEIGFDKSVHSFILHFSAYDFWKKHKDKYSFIYVVNDLKKGKSRKKVLNEILDLAGL